MEVSKLDSQLERLTNTTTSEYSDSDKHNDLTRATHEMITEIKQAQDSWDFQGEIATTDLNSVSTRSDREYEFPSDILQIKRIEVDPDGDGNFVTAGWIDSSEVGSALSTNDEIEDEFSNDEPYVELFDEGFFVYSDSIDATVSDGIKIWYVEELVGEDDSGNDLTEFSSDTDEPKIAEGFQLGLVYKAAKFYAQANEYWEKASAFDAEYEKVVKRVRDWYGNRAPDAPIRVSSASDLNQYE